MLIDDGDSHGKPVGSFTGRPRGILMAACGQKAKTRGT